jgi:hypothetical protein
MRAVRLVIARKRRTSAWQSQFCIGVGRHYQPYGPTISALRADAPLVGDRFSGMPWRVPFWHFAGTIHSESRSKLVNISHFDGKLNARFFSAASLASTASLSFSSDTRVTVQFLSRDLRLIRKGTFMASATIGEI